MLTLVSGEVHSARGRGGQAAAAPEQRPRPLPEASVGRPPHHRGDRDRPRVRGIHGGRREQRQPRHEPSQQHHMRSVCQYYVLNKSLNVINSLLVISI